MEFHEKLAEIRKSSRWPDQEDFSRQVGLSLGGYKKYERGERLPDGNGLLWICRQARLDERSILELTKLWKKAKARQAGIDELPTSQPSAVDSDAIARRIQNEVSYVLKQARIVVPDNTKRVMENRIAIILKSSLGE